MTPLLWLVVWALAGMPPVQGWWVVGLVVSVLISLSFYEASRGSRR